MSTSALQVTSLSATDRAKLLFDYANAFGSNRYTEIAIVEAAGRVAVASTGAPSYADKPRLVREFAAAARPGIIGLTHFADQSQDVFVVYAPLFDENAHRVGTLVARLQTTELAARLSRLRAAGERRARLRALARKLSPNPDSAIAVEPLTSQKSTLTMRRSPCIVRLARAASSLLANASGMRRSARGGSVVRSSKRWPQLRQNFAASTLVLPQLGHVRSNAKPQFSQNFASSLFLV